MDLRSYIGLKKAYRTMHSQQQVNEKVEFVEEGALYESYEQLGESSQARDPESGLPLNKPTRKDQPQSSAQTVTTRDPESGLPVVSKVKPKTNTSGNRDPESGLPMSSSSSRRSSSSSSGARDPESGLPMSSGSRSSSSSSRSSNSGARDPESGLPMSRSGSSSNSGTSQSAQSSSRRSSSSGSSGSSQRASSSSAQRSSGSSSSQPVARATSSAPKGDTMADKSKSERMAAWAKANPKLAKAQQQRQATRGTTASSNPMMRGLGTAPKKSTTTAPKASTTGNKASSFMSRGGSAATKATPSPGARAALSAAGAKFNPNAPKIKLTNSVDMSEFDIIIEHLVEQGFPVEEALKLMVNMPEEKRAQILEAGMHREADTGKVVDKAEVGKTYYPNMPKKKSSVALRKEKEAAEKKKTQKEEVESIEENRRAARAAGGYKDDSKKQTDPSKDGFTGISGSIKEIMKQNKAIEAAKKKKTQKEEMQSLVDAYRSMYVKEEESDARKDRQLERGGMAARADYSKPPTNPEKKGERKAGPSAMDVVKAELKKKYGDKAIIDTKKKKD